VFWFQGTGLAARADRLLGAVAVVGVHRPDEPLGLGVHEVWGEEAVDGHAALADVTAGALDVRLAQTQRILAGDRALPQLAVADQEQRHGGDVADHVAHLGAAVPLALGRVPAAVGPAHVRLAGEGGPLHEPVVAVEQHLVRVPDQLIEQLLVAGELDHRQQALDHVGGQAVDVVVLPVADEHVIRAVALLHRQLGAHLVLEGGHLGGCDRPLQALDQEVSGGGSGDDDGQQGRGHEAAAEHEQGLVRAGCRCSPVNNGSPPR
jgi:hypothetical protein